MPKHNNQVPNGHFKKQWQRRVKTWFDQAPKARKRAALRKEKARKAFPRPVAGPLRPVVQCQSIRYNSRSRLGRGFTFEELKAAKINRRQALTIGIAVDHRRKNRSVEAMEKNVARLSEYKSKLILFPLHPNKKDYKPNKSDASVAACKAATQHTGPLFPVKPFPVRTLETRPITEEEKKFRAFETLRQARANARIVGRRHLKKKKDQDAPKASAE